MLKIKSNKKNRFSYICYRILRFFVKLFYQKASVEGMENLKNEPTIIVGNHTKMNGPLIAEFYIPGKRAIWCASQMMDFKRMPAYAFEDFWRDKPKFIKPFYRLLSYIISPVSVCIFKNANTIPVYYDAKVVTTFRKTVDALNEGANIVIYPECRTERSHIINEFRDKFIDVARLYYKKTGKAVSFAPMYVAPALKKAVIGKTIRYNPDAPIEAERKRICEYLMAEVENIAVSLPRHKVVPYKNMPKKYYPYSKDE